MDNQSPICSVNIGGTLKQFGTIHECLFFWFVVSSHMYIVHRIPSDPPDPLIDPALEGVRIGRL